MALNIELDDAVTQVEQRLSALNRALCAHDAVGIELCSTELQRALGGAVDQLARSPRGGPMPLELRRRLALAGGLVAAQRESLARATAALDRAIEVLIPPPVASFGYAANGRSERSAGSGVIQA